MEWSEEKILEYVSQGWTLSWDRTNKKYKLQKRINGKVKSYTLPKRFNEFCDKIKEEKLNAKYLKAFKMLDEGTLITTIMDELNIDEFEIYDIFDKYVNYKLESLDSKEILKKIWYNLLCLQYDLEEASSRINNIENRINQASKVVRTGFGFAKLTFQCPKCLEVSTLRYDSTAKRWVCSKCNEVPF